MSAHQRFGQLAMDMGAKIVSSNALEAPATATSIRGDVVTDGPFVETRTDNEAERRFLTERLAGSTDG